MTGVPSTTPAPSPGTRSTVGPAEGLIPPSPSPTSATASTNCVAALAGLRTCMGYVTGTDSEMPTPQSECCSGLAGFLNSSRAAALAGDGNRELQCLCPILLGQINPPARTNQYLHE
ncbi:hypothetical protein ACP70R_020325 [Stipagrostis hirtigluma subsp. patula]